MTNLHGKQILIAATLIGLSMLLTGNLWGVIETSEARYAEISREMYRSGDWLHPRLLNIHHYHKPPVTYWFTAIAYSLFGVNAFAARFFLVLSFGLQVFLLYQIAKLLFRSENVASYSALVYATLPLVLVSARGLTTDSYLTTFVLLSLFCGIRFFESKNVFFLYGMALSLGLGFLVKGPVIFIVPVLAMVGMRPPWTSVKLWQALSALAMFVAVGFSWFAILVVEDSRFADYFFFRHFVDRLTKAEVFAREKPWYFYLPIIPMVTIPWITFFVGGILAKKSFDGDLGIAKRIILWWILFPLIIFSISSSKLVLYILPLSIGFSLATGYYLAQGIPRTLFTISAGLVVVINICLVVVSIFYPQLNIDNTLVVSSSAALAVSLGIWLLNLSREISVLFLGTLFATNLILFSSQFFNLNSNEVNSLKCVSSYIRQQGLQERAIIVYDELLPSIAFELDKEIISVYAGDRSLKRETQFEHDDRWRQNLIDATDRARITYLQSILSKKSVLIVKNEMPEQLDSLLTGTWYQKAFGKWKVLYN